MPIHSKLGLGGHTFIAELGNDPLATFEEQCEIVRTCLNESIHLIDTTYYQERAALGQIFTAIGRREEARVMAWNFFKEPGKENELVPFTPFESAHIRQMLEELQTDSIDILVIHAHDDSVKLKQELSLAKQWMSEGKVKKVGLGMAQLKHLQLLPDDHPVTHVLAPYNAFRLEAAEMFTYARDYGMTTIALSPFIRGWKLDELGEQKSMAADLLLRWVTQQPLIDHVIVSMRAKDWIHANLQAAGRGPLNEKERTIIDNWTARIG
ncbi:aldo/keto reductase [Paenibacillus solisilvae]|uniref:Aldo/keto reductase n=1 Tax=Paenibacillus solisilvae TaxID=2486751 RepID=A0ABW0VZL9_9BACL